MPQANICPACGRENRAGAAFCSACGAALQGESAAPKSQPVGQAPIQAPGVTPDKASGQAPEQTPPVPPVNAMGQPAGAQPVPPPDGNPPEGKKKAKMPRGKKAALLGGAGVVVLGLLAVLVFLVILPMMQPKGIDPVSLYAKDGEIYYVNESGEEVAVTQQLFLDDSIGSQLMTSDWWAVSYYLALSDDGTRIFYPDQIAGDASNIPLYTRLVSEPADKAVLVDTDVAQYQITPDGKKVTYINGSDYALYQSDLANRTRIAADVNSFISSKDGQTVFYINESGALYQWTASGGETLITDATSASSGFAKNKMAAYYIADDTLYECTAESGTPKQVGVNVQDIVWITPDGQVYYTVGEEDGLTLMDFVDDDVEAGGTVTKPEEPDVPVGPKRENYKDDASYEKAREQYEKEWEEYQQAMDDWQQDVMDFYDEQEAAEEADSARAYLESTSASDFVADLYYYDGNTTNMVAENVSVNDWRGPYGLMSSMWNSYAQGPMGFVTQWDPDTMEKVSLAQALEESDSSYDVSQVVENELKEAMDGGLTGIVVGGSCTFGSDGMRPVAFTRDGSVVYTFLYDAENPGNGLTLYRTPIQDGKLGTQEAIQSGVTPVAVLKDGRLAYGIYSTDGLTLDLYVDGVKVNTIDAGYGNGEAVQGSDGESLAYFSTWDSEQNCGTLSLWRDGENVTVASNVRLFQMLDDGRILCLYDFDEETGTGTVGVFQNGTLTPLSQTANSLLAVIEVDTYGMLY